MQIFRRTLAAKSVDAGIEAERVWRHPRTSRRRWVAVTVVALFAATLLPAPTAAHAIPGPGTSSTGGGLISAVSRGPGRFDVFYRNKWGSYYHKTTSDGFNWTTEYIGGADSLTGRPVAIVNQTDFIELFVADMWGRVFHKRWTGREWYPSQAGWDFLGGSFTGTVSVTSQSPNQVNIFARGTDGILYYKELNFIWWWPRSETEWFPMGDGIVGAPSATSWGPGRMDVFVRRTDNRLYTRSWHGYWDPSLTGFEDLGGDIGEAPVAVSWDTNRIDVFVKDRVNGRLYHKWAVGEDWGPSQWGYEYMDGLMDGMPSIVCVAPERIHILATGTDGGLYYKAWTGHSWVPSLTGYDFIPTPVTLSGPPAAVSSGPDSLHVFSMGTDGNVYDTIWLGWWYTHAI